MNKTGEIVISHFTAVAVIAVALPAVAAAGHAASVMGNSILGNDDAAGFRSALTYLVFTAVIGAVFAVLTSLRFPESGRRMCAAWGMTAALVVLALLLCLFTLLVVGFLQIDVATPRTPRQLLAQSARNWLPAITLLTYMAAFAWGLFSPSNPASARKWALQLAGVSVIAAIPSVTAVLWFVWQA